MYATIAVPRTDKLGRSPVRSQFRISRCARQLVLLHRSLHWVRTNGRSRHVHAEHHAASREHDLDTCPQEAWAVWYKTIREYLSIPPEHMLFCGMALGYRDPAAPINRLRTERASSKNS